MIERLKRSKVECYVYAGAAFLDAALGTKWRKKIDPERLALDDGKACILGQLYGEYEDGFLELDLEHDNLYGFNVKEASGYDELTAAWRKVLKATSTSNRRKRRKHT